MKNDTDKGNSADSLVEKAMCFECSGVGGYHDGGWVDCPVCDGSGLNAESRRTDEGGSAQ